MTKTQILRRLRAMRTEFEHNAESLSAIGGPPIFDDVIVAIDDAIAELERKEISV